MENTMTLVDLWIEYLRELTQEKSELIKWEAFWGNRRVEAPEDGDLITDWFSYTSATQDDRSPEIFRKWSGIALVAGAMERKITVRTGMNTTYCNLYTLLVGPSGTGKYIVNTVREFWKDAKEPHTGAKAFKVAADSLTKASLVDSLAKATQVKIRPDGQNETYHSLLIAAEEFNVLLPSYDMEYIGTLNAIWNNKPSHDELRRFGVLRVEIEKPQLNILGGVQPSFLANVFPDEVWTTGLARRIMMIYSDERRIRDPFTEYPDPFALRERIQNKLARIALMWGEIGWTEGAREFFREWVLSGSPPIPQHSRLQGYVRERERMVMKLVGISSVSRKIDLSPIEVMDVERALGWLFEAEKVMPEIFRAMLAKSDWAVVEELYLWIMSLWTKGGHKPIQGKRVYEFVGERAPAEKVERIVAMAIRTRTLECVDQGGDLWKPLPKVFRTGE